MLRVGNEYAEHRREHKIQTLVKIAEAWSKSNGEELDSNKGLSHAFKKEPEGRNTDMLMGDVAKELIRRKITRESETTQRQDAMDAIHTQDARAHEESMDPREKND
jgi:hypothetical protein